MAVAPMYFQPLSPQQANPGLYQAQQRALIQGQTQANLSAMMQNQMLNQQVPYAGQMAQANLANTQAQAPYMWSQTDLNNAMLPYAGYKAMGPYIGGLARMQQASVSYYNAFRQASQTPEGQALLQSDPGFRQAYNQAMANEAQFINSGFPMMGGGMPPMAGNMVPQPWAQPNFNPQPQPQMAGGQSAPPANGAPMNVPNMSNYQQLPITPAQTQQLQSLFGYSPQKDASLQQVSQNQSALQNYDKDQQKRLAAGQRFKTTSAQLMQDFDNGAGYYFSPQGQEQLKIDEVNAASGKVPPRLQAYRNFQQDVNTANLQGALLESVPADQIARGDYKEIFEPAKWANNPQGARAQMVNAMNLALKADSANKITTGQAVNQTDSLYPVKAPAQGNGQYQVRGMRGPVTLTDADIVHTAQLHGLTVAQVKQQLGIQ